MKMMTVLAISAALLVGCGKSGNSGDSASAVSSDAPAITQNDVTLAEQGDPNAAMRIADDCAKEADASTDIGMLECAENYYKKAAAAGAKDAEGKLAAIEPLRKSINERVEYRYQEQRRIEGTIWTLQTFADELTGKDVSLAAVKSTNELHFSFPYNEPQRALLSVRKHPRSGVNVYMQINGQFICSSYEGCSVQVVFDDGDIQTYSMTTAADYSSNILFFRNESRFLSQIRKAKEVRIGANVYEQGTQTFIFKVDNYPFADRA